jgi:uncharacterized iron-regulated protein
MQNLTRRFTRCQQRVVHCGNPSIVDSNIKPSVPTVNRTQHRFDLTLIGHINTMMGIAGSFPVNRMTGTPFYQRSAFEKMVNQEAPNPATTARYKNDLSFSHGLTPH